MAEGTTVSCEPCGYDGLSKSAHSWCNDCGEGFCDECVKDHKRTKILRSHHLISITDYLKSTELFIDENCEHHKEPYEFFCSQHDAILCLKCFQEHHNLENEIQSTSRNIAEYHEEEDKYSTDLKQQEQNIRDEVYNIRSKFNKHLDRLQEKVIKDLEMKYNNCTKNVNENESALKIHGNTAIALHNRISDMKKPQLFRRCCRSRKSSKTVQFVDLSKKQAQLNIQKQHSIEEINLKLHHPIRILIPRDVDNHCNVFIVLPDFDKVIVISSDGQQHRVILDKSNNLKGPSGISYSRETHQLNSMAEGTTVSCEPCGYDGLSKSAHSWCTYCGEVSVKNVSKITKGQITISPLDINN
ncbi:unnamed protein product [Mytilus edulis]|uniref:B box-type domain-containing protein n=1 Tax=Mytilus edulis TaxID=6550 RepID=A0A8S3T7G8_MYTED|nr:unnamed protein product [Mytilus edulis]